jgi:uncharacterized damage-inducible protein DinB
MKYFLLALVMFGATGISRSQTNAPPSAIARTNETDNSLTAETRHVFQSISANTLKAAREMPEGSYNFRPTNDVRTFGALIEHIATVQVTLCSNVNGHSRKVAASQTSKDRIVQELADSAQECQDAFDGLSAENASKFGETPAGKVTHLVALLYIITHASEEYGQLSIYLRLNHLTPPTSDEPGNGGSAGKAKT